ncbi:MAG: hypothetical protein VYC39_12390 [Myxococcota bacterium]|nr:hypothetical protein [Myxococcota bacterium]
MSKRLVADTYNMVVPKRVSEAFFRIPSPRFENITNKSMQPNAARDTADVLILSNKPHRSRKLLSSFSPIGVTPRHVSSISQMLSEIRTNQYRLVIVDSYGMNIEPVSFIKRIRIMDSYLTVLYLGDISAVIQRRIENYGGVLTSRARTIRNNLKLAAGRLLAHHHALANLRVDLSRFNA